MSPEATLQGAATLHQKAPNSFVPKRLGQRLRCRENIFGPCLLVHATRIHGHPGQGGSPGATPYALAQSVLRLQCPRSASDIARGRCKRGCGVSGPEQLEAKPPGLAYSAK